ncbi:hypothetical protein MD484_g4979, partial [Candolleomyces efflorescens]
MSKLPTNGAHPPLGTLIHDDTIQLVSVLGNGGYGVVFLGVDISSKRHRKYAVKCMSKAKGRRTAHVRELNFHLQVTGHPGVIECYGAVEDEMFTYFIMEYATSNDLFHQILHESRYLAKDDTIKYVFLQLLEGVQHCHKMGVFHRDLKPENVMCFDDGHRVAITDFGLATSDPSSCEFRTGSVYHMSPECQAGHFREDAYSPVANDVWSLGIILVNMVTGRNPWKSATKEDPVYQNYLQGPLTFFSSVLPVSKPLNNLLVRVLNPDWKSRMSLHDLKHAIQDISTFYSVNVHFEGNLARYCWEVGIKARTDLVDGLFGPIPKRPVPPTTMKQTVPRKPVSPIHEEAKASPVEVSGPSVLRKRVDPPLASPKIGSPSVRRPRPPPIHAPPYHTSLAPATSPRHDSMVSITLDEEHEARVPVHISTSVDGTRGPSSQDSSFSSSFPKTPATSPHRVTMVKRRPRIPSDQLHSPSYSPALDDPMEFYGLEFCKRLAALPSDADSDDTESEDDGMASHSSSSRYSLHEMPGCLSCRTRSSGETSSGSSTASDPPPHIIRIIPILIPIPPEAHTMDSGTVGSILRPFHILILILSLTLILIHTNHRLHLSHHVPLPFASLICVRSGTVSPFRDRHRRILGCHTLLVQPLTGIIDIGVNRASSSLGA